MVPATFPKDRLGLCMIVKDEARTLARCLASVRPWVGELVVVDTGSTDDTVAIAQAHGAKVGHFPWCDDFAAARNAALDLATREWVLILDADEEWIVDDPDEFGRALEQAVIDGFSIRIKSLNDDGTMSQAMVFRMFRRAVPNMRYRGQIHEQVVAVTQREVSTAALACAHLTHDGYTSAVAIGRDKNTRNITLSRALAESRPDDAYAQFALAVSLAPVDVPGMLVAADKAIALLAQEPNGGSGEQWVVSLFLTAVLAHRHRGDHARAQAMADRGLAMFPLSPDLLYQRGGARLAQGDAAGAADDFAAALTPAAAAFMLVADAAATGHGSRTCLGQALRELGRYDEAEESLRQAIAEAPANYPAAHKVLGTMVLQRGDWAAARPLLEEAHRRAPGDPEAAFNMAWCQYKLERYADAAVVLRPLAGRPDADHLLARVLLENGKAAEALPLLQASPLPAAQLALGWAHFVLGDANAAAKSWDAWMRAGAADWGTKDALATFMYLLGGGSRPSGEPERPAEPLGHIDSWFRLLLRYRKFDEIETLLNRAPALGDRLWRPLRLGLAITLVRDGFSDLATSLLLDAVRDQPTNASAYYWLGHCAVLREQLDDARVMFMACLRQEPNFKDASDALALLK